MAIWPFRHLGLKVVSVVMAVLVWLMVASEEAVERGLRVPLEFQQFPAGLELEGEPPTVVDVRVRGAESHVARIAPGDVVAVLDVGAAAPGQRLFTLSPEQVRVPFGVEVVQVQPSTIAIMFGKSETRELPVQAQWEGDPAPGFVVGAVKVDPQVVEVIGPAGALSRTTAAVTETVSVAGALQTFTKSVTIGFLDPALRLKSPRRASVTVEVLPGPRERRINVPVHLQHVHAALTAQASPAVVEVVLRGSREALSAVKDDEVTAYVDVSGLGVGEYMLTVHADHPAQAGVTAINPDSVKVSVSGGRD
jgi:YbbR domain-containing protein